MKHKLPFGAKKIMTESQMSETELFTLLAFDFCFDLFVDVFCFFPLGKRKYPIFYRSSQLRDFGLLKQWLFSDSPIAGMRSFLIGQIRFHIGKTKCQCIRAFYFKKRKGIELVTLRLDLAGAHF